MAKNKGSKTITVNGIKEIVDKISQREITKGITKVDIKKVLDSLLGVIDDSLMNGEEVEFIGHFKMYTVEQEEKEITLQFGENKGKMQKVSARLVPRVKFSPTFKKQLIEE